MARARFEQDTSQIQVQSATKIRNWWIVFFIKSGVSESRGSLVGIGSGYELDDRGSIPGRGWDFSSSPPRSDRFWAHPASYPLGSRGSFPGVKRRESEANHSPPSSAEVFMAWCLVKKHRGRFKSGVIR
jgi:hypothetical protein